MHRITESLYCSPKTTITLYVNYTGIQIKKINKDVLSLGIRWVLSPTLPLEAFNSALEISQKCPSVDKPHKGHAS